MKNRYENIRIKENEIYESIEGVSFPNSKLTGNELFDKGLDWLCQDADCILDFGCGNGTLLFLCSLHGIQKHIGIDLSDSAIKLAEKRKSLASNGDFTFINGGIEKLNTLQDIKFDAFVLSNVLDNLYPEDAINLLKEAQRLLKSTGKVLVKVNPYIEKHQIQEWGIKVIKDNFLDDGFYLWNNTTNEWKNILSDYFDIAEYQDIYYPEHDMYNRMFLLTKK
ncbi:class I SAM-dependent methyltransferase [Anaerocolumna jejuensis]|uniref:class I SAM-dependent methyltransferase n=1 Tax=Anaerocolumna jejuensis TaxID=259063 RepID=UPI003F7B8156